jgi:hypothetical protein
MAPSTISPVGDCVARRKSHECHSEPQAKNLAFPGTYEGEILRLSPQDDIATQSLAGEKIEGVFFAVAFLISFRLGQELKVFFDPRRNR